MNSETVVRNQSARSDGDSFQARNSSRRQGSLVALGIVFCLFGAWRAGLLHASVPVALSGSVFGWACILFFGPYTIVAIAQFRYRGPILEIGTDGIRYARWADHVIPWSDIVSVKRKQVRFFHVTCVRLRDPERYPRSWMPRLASALNRLRGHGDLTLSIVGTDRKQAELDAAITRFWTKPRKARRSLSQ